MPDRVVAADYSMVDGGLRSSCNSSKNRPDEKVSAAQKEILLPEHIKSRLKLTSEMLNDKM